MTSPRLSKRQSFQNYPYPARTFVCSALVCLNVHFSAVHSVVIVCARDIRLLFKLPLKFQNVLKHTKCRSSFACNQNIKEDIPTEFGVFLCLKTKRNINRSSRKTSTRRENWVQERLPRGSIWGSMEDSLSNLGTLLLVDCISSIFFCHNQFLRVKYWIYGHNHYL